MLAQLHRVDGAAAGLGRDVQHGGGSGPLGGRLVQRGVLHLHGAELALEQVEGAAARRGSGRPRDLPPVPHHDDGWKTGAGISSNDMYVSKGVGIQYNVICNAVDHLQTDACRIFNFSIVFV